MAIKPITDFWMVLPDLDHEAWPELLDGVADKYYATLKMSDLPDPAEPPTRFKIHPVSRADFMELSYQAGLSADELTSLSSDKPDAGKLVKSMKMAELIAEKAVVDIEGADSLEALGRDLATALGFHILTYTMLNGKDLGF